MRFYRCKRLFVVLPGVIAIAALVWILTSVAERGMYVRPGTKAEMGEHKWAVIIGINDYRDEVIADLKYAVADAQGIYELLTHGQHGAFEKDKVQLLTDGSHTKPTRENILIALTSIESVADEDDTIFISFSGHGIEESGVSYFLPNDANISILRDTGIPMERFTDTLNRTKAKVQVMFFDACHSGVRRGKSLSGQLGETQFSRIFAEADGRAILCSCDADEVSWEYPDQGHGVFTYYLMDALKGNADANTDGFVTVSEASNYVTENVKEWAFENGRKQNPRLSYNVSGEIVLTLSQGEEKPEEPTAIKEEPEKPSTAPATAAASTASQLKPTSLPKEITGKDGAPMVLIPAGEFQMGNNNGDIDEKPVHTVYLNSFYMDKYEMTNALYRNFMDATGHRAPVYWSKTRYNRPNQPVVGVSWDDAVAYAKWAGKRLPTEAEWEKAARGGLAGKKYPCGDEVTHDNANYGGTDGKDRWEYTSPVGSFSPNGYGLYDMAGNVYEWCADWYDPRYYANSLFRSLTGPASGRVRVLRGGSWEDKERLRLRVAHRPAAPPSWNSPLRSGERRSNIGFRCVQDVEP